eukprot:g2440.t1
MVKMMREFGDANRVTPEYADDVVAKLKKEANTFKAYAKDKNYKKAMKTLEKYRQDIPFGVGADGGYSSSAQSLTFNEPHRRFDAASGTYWGQWAEEFLDQPLDVLVFSMSRCDAHFKSLVCGRKSQEVFSELFGLAGGMQGEKMLLRCFYLTKPREASDLFM